MNSSVSIRAILIFIAAAALALWLGVSVATDQFETLFKVVGAVGFIICALLGRRIWLLMILFMAMNVPLIRGFSTTELGQGLFLAFTCLIFLLRRQPFNFRLGELEVWMLLLALMVAQVYLRNPVGLNVFGASSVGARPYLVIALAWTSSMLLGSLVVPSGEIRWAMRLTILGAVAGVLLTGLRMRLLGGGGGDSAGGIDASTAGSGSSRISSFGYLGMIISRFVSSYVSPLRACVHPLWGFLILVSLAAAAASGYRNAVASVGLTYLVGIAYRGGFMSVLIASLAAAFGLGALALLNLAMPLPPNIQRALSPFPGTWEERHVKAAEDSTEWRVEMWKQALFTEYWIQNKLLGDGLGFSRRELQLMEAAESGLGYESLGSGLSAQQESLMINGAYHSGPVQTVRTVGYVGLLILLLAMIRLAVHAHRQVKRCRNTDWYPFALFVAIPIVVAPIFFVFVFGEFGAAAATFCGSYGIIRLMEKNLPLPDYVIPQRMPYLLNRRLPSSSMSPASQKRGL